MPSRTLTLCLARTLTVAHRWPSASIVIEYAEPKRNPNPNPNPNPNSNSNSNSNTEVNHENKWKGNSGLPPTQSHMDTDEWTFL